MQQLNKKAIWLFFFGFVIRGLFVLTFTGIWISAFFAKGVAEGGTINIPSWWWFIVFVYLAICYVWAEFYYKFYKYELTDKGFRKESGILYKRYVTIPYERIQNIDINRGIIAQILGLSDLNIQTAGSGAMTTRNGFMTGMGAEGQLPGLTKEIAEKVRDELIERTKNVNNPGL